MSTPSLGQVTWYPPTPDSIVQERFNKQLSKLGYALKTIRSEVVRAAKTSRDNGGDTVKAGKRFRRLIAKVLAHKDGVYSMADNPQALQQLVAELDKVLPRLRPVYNKLKGNLKALVQMKRRLESQGKPWPAGKVTQRILEWKRFFGVVNHLEAVRGDLQARYDALTRPAGSPAPPEALPEDEIFIGELEELTPEEEAALDAELEALLGDLGL